MRLEWDKDAERYYELGVDQVVLYVRDASGAYPNGVNWNGVTGITENPSGAEPNDFYADNIKYGTIRSNETFGATINAYTYPEEWEQCDGADELTTGISIGQQQRKAFGLCYRTKIGNDVDGVDHGYKYHFVYGGTASPSSRDNQTMNESPEAMSMSWEVSTTPVKVANKKPTSHLVIDSTKISEAKLNAVLDAVYGTANSEPYLPLPDALLTLVNAVVEG